MVDKDSRTDKVLTFLMSVLAAIFLLTLTALILAIGFSLSYSLVTWALGGNCG